MRTPATAGIIGSGIAGLACAQTLRDSGVLVTVFDKSRGTGGRCATRRIDAALGVDHGAQYFTVRDPRFAEVVNRWCAAGTAALWSGRIVSLTRGAVAELAEPPDRYVGIPGMSALARQMAAGLDVRTNVTVQRLDHDETGWSVVDSAGATHGPFDWLVCTAPPFQARTLIEGHSPALSESLANVSMDPCWAVILQLKDALHVPFDAAFVQESPLAWIALNDSKPQRQLGHCWTLHATSEWSREHLERSADDVAPSLLDAFWQATGQASQTPASVTGHRWRYALPVTPLPQRFLLDAHTRLAACGDWCGGPRIEGAFLSGIAAAEALSVCA